MSDIKSSETPPISAQSASGTSTSPITSNGTAPQVGLSAGTATQSPPKAKSSANSNKSTSKPSAEKTTEKSTAPLLGNAFLGGAGGPTWLMEQWRGLYDQQMSFIRENLSSIPNAVKANVDQSKSAITEATDSIRETSQSMVGGMRTINRQVIDNMQSDVNRVLELSKALTEAKNVSEAVEIQKEFIQDTVQAQMQQTKDLSELTLETTRESFEPITERVQHFYGTLGKKG